jgi:hypothetical protein
VVGLDLVGQHVVRVDVVGQHLVRLHVVIGLVGRRGRGPLAGGGRRSSTW